MREQPQDRTRPRGKLSAQRDVHRAGHMASCELVTGAYIEGQLSGAQHDLQLRWPNGPQCRQIRQGRSASAVDLGVLEEIVRPGRKIAGQLRDEFFPAFDL